MCDVSSALIGGVLGFGQSLSSQYGQYQQQQADYQRHLIANEIGRRQADDEARARAAEAVLRYQQIQIAQQEVNAAATQEKADVAREMQRARALSELASTEAGVRGVSVDRLGIDMAYTQAQKNAAIETTRVSQIDQLQAEKDATRLAAQTQPFYYHDGVEPSFGLSNILSAGWSGLTGYYNAGGFTNLFSKNKRISETSSYSVGNSRFGY